VAEAGLLDRAIYVERGTMADELVMKLAEKTDGAGPPYFSLILIPGQGRRAVTGRLFIVGPGAPVPIIGLWPEATAAL